MLYGLVSGRGRKNKSPLSGGVSREFIKKIKVY